MNCNNYFDMTDQGDSFETWQGLRGPYYTPHVAADGVLSWTNTGNLPNPAPVDIKGTDGKSAYQAAVEAGFTGTEAEFSEYLSGIGDLTQEVADQKSAIEDLEALTNRKAGALVDTASGAIASFVPDATIPDLLGVSVAVEPVQDLHGYDNPWPAGGGKNKASYVYYQSATGQSSPVISGSYKLVSGKRYVISFDTPNTGVKVYRQSPESLGFSSLSQYDFTLDGNKKSLWGVASGDFTIENKSIIVKSATTETESGLCSNFMIEEVADGVTTPTSYAPYSNICPISGWTGANVYRTGVNLLDISAAEVGTAWNGAANTARARLVIPIKRNTQYILTMNGTNSLDGVFSALSTTVPPSGIGGRTFPYSFNSGENDYLVLGFNKDAISQSDLEALNLQLELGSTASSYHPYAGNRYTITLGQTVYGGTLDVTAGKLTVDRAGFVPTQMRAGAYSTGGKFYPWIDLPSLSIAFSQAALCNKLKCVSSIADFSANVSFLIRADYLAINPSGAGYASQNDAIAAGNAFLSSGDVKFCYPLATPITITLDPVQIAAIAHQTNNLWSDAGDVDVTYAADLKAYIDRPNQPTEDDMIANSLIAANKYFTVNNRLFLSTASIAAGAQIIPGTNCTETSLAAALNALNA